MDRVTEMFEVDPNIDRATYGELAQDGPAGASAISPDGWRHLGPVPVAPRVSRAEPGPKLYRRALAGSFAEERDRALAIVAVAKQAIVETFHAASFGGPLKVDALEPVIAAIGASIDRNPLAIPSVTRLKTRHEYTYLHSVAVCGLMLGLARELKLDPKLYPVIGMAGLLHDVGKALTPQRLLDKPGPLTDQEFAVVQRHPERGLRLLEESPGVPDVAKQVCLHHHERIDGRGYPSRVSANELSVFVRMAAICDVYDAVTSVRAYKNSWSSGAAIDWMRSTQGHFDARILKVFIEMLGAFPVGTLVRLTSDRLAVVLDDPDADPLRPVVVAFHCALRSQPIDPRVVVTINDPILCVERSEDWKIEDWTARREALLAFPR